MSVPRIIPEEILADNSAFAAILHRLEISKYIAKGTADSQQTYGQISLLHNLVNDVILDLDKDDHDLALKLRKVLSIETIKENLLKIDLKEPQLKDSWHFVDSNIIQQKWTAEFSPEVQSRLMCLLKKKMKLMYGNLLNVWNCYREEATLNDNSAIEHLAKSVRTAKQELEDRRAALEKATKRFESMILQYKTVILDNLRMQRELIESHLLVETAKYKVAKKEFLTQKFDCLLLTIRALEAELNQRTYSQQTVDQLRKISARLDDQLIDLRKEKSELTKTLDAYQAQGDSFKQMASEYGQIISDIQQNEWAMQALLSTSASYS